MTELRNLRRLAGFVILAAALLVFVLTAEPLPPYLKRAKDFLKLENGAEVLEVIRKEVSNPGGLVARFESAQTLLTPAGILAFTNRERTAYGIALLRANASLDTLARRRLDDMFAKQYFEHVSPTGSSASSEAEAVGYEYLTIGENIALGNFGDDEKLVAAWMNSPGHRANILNPKFLELGRAVGKGTYQGKATWLAIQIFARPLSICGSVDVSLKEGIDAILAERRELEEEIKTLAREIENAKRSDRERYNMLVDEYNVLVADYNMLSEQAKELTVEYNAGVRAFNACVQNQ